MINKTSLNTSKSKRLPSIFMTKDYIKNLNNPSMVHYSDIDENVQHYSCNGTCSVKSPIKSKSRSPPKSRTTSRSRSPIKSNIKSRSKSRSKSPEIKREEIISSRRRRSVQPSPLTPKELSEFPSSTDEQSVEFSSSSGKRKGASLSKSNIKRQSSRED